MRKGGEERTELSSFLIIGLLICAIWCHPEWLKISKGPQKVERNSFAMLWGNGVPFRVQGAWNVKVLGDLQVLPSRWGLTQVSCTHLRGGAQDGYSFEVLHEVSMLHLVPVIWEKFLLNSFFLNLQLNGNKMIHNMSKLLKFLLSSSGPKPQSIVAKLPLGSQGSWWSRVIEHSWWGRKLFLKRACGNQSWESWYSNWCLFLLPFLRFKKEKVNLDIKEKTKIKLLCLLLHYKSKI